MEEVDVEDTAIAQRLPNYKLEKSTIMKNTVFTVVAAFVLVTFFACNKDRITGDTYESMDEFFDLNKVEEQEFIINETDTAGPIVGNQGTEIYIGHRIFQYTNKPDDVTYPYILKLVELYKYKDIIFYKMPTPHSAGALDNGGEIRVRAFKDGEELMLIPGSYLKTVFSSDATASDMNPFQGEAPGDVFSQWNLASDGSVVLTSNSKYVYNTFTMGWLTPAKNRAASAKSDIKFEVKGTGGAYINLAICFKDFHCVLTGNNLVLEDVPVGEEATIVAMAKDQNGKFRLHQQSLTTSADLTIDLDMKEVSESELIAFLEGL